MPLILLFFVSLFFLLKNWVSNGTFQVFAKTTLQAQDEVK